MVLLLYTFVAFVTTTAADKKGYLVSEFPKIECNDPSTAIPECLGFLDYKIANFSFPWPNGTGLLDELRKDIPELFQHHPSSDNCSDSVKKYICELAYPFRCLDKYYDINNAAINTTCNEGRTTCAWLLPPEMLDSTFNCSGIDENLDLLKFSRIPREPSCVALPVVKNDPYSCKTNFKVIHDTFFNIM